VADDARLSTALPRHPKTVKLKRRLGEAGCWGLVCLFLWVADNRSDGDLSGLSSEDLEIAADWSGDPGLFVATLEGVGFLDGSEGSHSIHDWQEHNPFAATRGKRVAAAKKAAAVRWGCESDAERIPDAQKGNAHHTTTPHPTKPKQVLENQAEEIYKHYPRKVGKPAAIKAIISAIAKVKGDSDFLLKQTKTFAESPAGNLGEFTPHPSTWFNQERYNDDVIEWQRLDVRRPAEPSNRPNDSWMVYDPNKPSVYGGGQ
jgi:hypothetical protein